uniref:Uncharacterized protein AlNc14C22G2304 n=1 Tax=Albugo laibachii Nc14 TaxID=890382 RepID=F0W5Z9_9STRA|nr:conserved hypothetical protein [Albugo laibachii Nc14]|eukprot:CCA16541.1 conserved hypothetical protein [Albugo laibachii Nc14]
MLRSPYCIHDGTSINDDVQMSSLNIKERDRGLILDSVVQDLFARFYYAAKPHDSEMLPYEGYVAFYQRVALALFANISTDLAGRIAAEDWLYDNPPGAAADALHAKSEYIAFEAFAISVHEVAHLVLPINSPQSQLISFYRELEKSLFPMPEMKLCPIDGVKPICASFQQKIKDPSQEMAPAGGKTTSSWSLKHCIFDSRKSGSESSHLILEHPKENDKEEEGSKSCIREYSDGSLQISDSIGRFEQILRVACQPVLPRVIYDDWDEEEAEISTLMTQQASVIAVVGPTGAGKSTIAKYLATYLGFVLCSIETAVAHLIANYGTEARKRIARQKGIKYDLAGCDDNDIDARHDRVDIETSHVCEILERFLAGEAVSKSELVDTQMRYAHELLHNENVGVVLDDLFPSESCDVKCDYLIHLDGNDKDIEQRMHKILMNSTSGEHHARKYLSIFSQIFQKVNHHGKTSKEVYIDENCDPRHEKLMTSAGVKFLREDCDSDHCSFRNIAPVGILSAETMLRSDENLIYNYSLEHCSNGTAQISILATQPISTILEQCVSRMHGNLLGISNLIVPRKAVPTLLPDEIVKSSRSEQIIWLLQSITEVDPGNTEIDIWDSKQRTLSKRWKQFCSVSFDKINGNLAVSGDPLFSAYLHGHIYLLASEEYRDQFCKHPEKYLRRNPAEEMTLPSRIILGMESDDVKTIEKIAALFKIEHNISATQILETISSLKKALATRLLKGQSIPFDEILPRLSTTLMSLDSWLLFGMVPTTSVIETLTNHGVQIDAILMLDDSKNDSKSQSALLMDYKERKIICDIPIKVVDVGRNPFDHVLMLIRQAFNPFLPQSRVDTHQDGTFNDTDRSQYVKNEIASINTRTPNASVETVSSELTDDISTARSLLDSYDKQKMLGVTGLFCPVAWKTRKELVQSGPEHIATLNGYHYCFSGHEELDVFARNPWEYVPLCFADTDTTQFVPWMLLLNIPRYHVGQKFVKMCGEHFSLQEIEYDSVKEIYSEKLLVNSLEKPESQSKKEALYINAMKEVIFSSTAQERTSPSERPIIVSLQSTFDEGDVSTDYFVKALSEYKLSSLPLLVLTMDIAQESFIEQELVEWKKSLVSKKGKIDMTSLSVSKTHESISVHDDPFEHDNESIDWNHMEPLERENLDTQYRKGVSVRDSILERLKVRGITIVPLALAKGTFRQSLDQVKSLSNMLQRRKSSLFERCEVLTYQGMLGELQLGRSIISKFMTTCPLTFRSNAKHDSNSFQCVKYRSRLYFPDGEHNLKAFVASPATYVYKSNRSGESARMRLQCCIVGPPKVGKTRLALALASHYDLVYVSPYTAVTWIQRYLGYTLLGIHLDQSAKTWPPSVLYIALLHRICAGDCQSRGWVLDDFFSSEEEWEQTERINHKTDGAFPAIMFYLKSEEKHHNTYSMLTNSYTMAFGAFHLQQLQPMVDSTLSFWKTLDRAKEKVELYLRLGRDYKHVVLESNSMGPVGMYGVLLHRKTIEVNLDGNVRQFCPVELSQRCLLASHLTDRRHIVKYNGIYYFCANKENFDAFLQHADKFLAKISNEEHIKHLVCSPPVDLSVTSLFMDHISQDAEYKGFCPVTLKLEDREDAQVGMRKETTERWTHLVKGSYFHRATFRDKLYLFASEMQKQRFLYQPYRYIYQKLPKKLPPSVSQLSTCPKTIVPHYEQELDLTIQKAMLRIGNERPKLSGTSTKATACIFLGLMLKTENSAISEKTRSRYRNMLDEFQLDCGIIQVLRNLICSQMFCGAGINLIRAVRSGGDGSNNMSTSTEATAIKSNDTYDTQELRERFDMLHSESVERNKLNRYIVP